MEQEINIKNLIFGNGGSIIYSTGYNKFGSVMSNSTGYALRHDFFLHNDNAESKKYTD